MAGERLKQSVAAAIFCPDNPGLLLLVQRPEEPGEELPGVWGLPAVSLLPGEDDAAALVRLGRLKLGAELTPLRLLARGHQERPGYVLQMRLYEALMQPEEPTLAASDGSGVTFYAAWRWGEPVILREGSEQGSLCCRLFLEHWIGYYPTAVPRS